MKKYIKKLLFSLYLIFSAFSFLYAADYDFGYNQTLNTYSDVEFNSITVGSATIGNLSFDLVTTSTVSAKDASGLSLLDDGLNQGIFIEDGGNVGVGTSTPTAKFEVRSALSIISPDGNRGVFSASDRLYYSGIDIDFQNINLFNSNIIPRDEGGLSLYGNSSDVGIFISSETNVGIGTTEPNEKLAVIGNIRSEYGIIASTGIFSGNVYLATATGSVAIGTEITELGLNTYDGIISTGVLAQGNILNTSGAGTRLIWYPRKAAFRAGSVTGSQWDEANVGNFSFASGNATKAVGDYSSAFGAQSEAYGTGSLVMGSQSKAYGANSFSGGFLCISSGAYSSTFGLQNKTYGTGSLATGGVAISSGDYSTAMGFFATAQPYASLVLGRYNIISGTTDSWVDSEPVFVIGNGTGASDRSNAMTVLKNGNVGISTGTPSSALDVIGNVRTEYGIIASTGVFSGLVQVSSLTSTNQIQAGTLTAGTITDGTLTINSGKLLSGVTVQSNIGNFNIVYTTTIQAKSPLYISASTTTFNGGNVGIGTNNPFEKLEIVNGNIKTNYGISAATGVFSGAVTAGTLDTGNGAYELFAMDQNVLMTSTPTFASLNVTNEIIVDSISANGANGLYLLDDGNNGIFIENGGDVGIGTTNPVDHLEVIGNVRATRMNVYGVEVGTGIPNTHLYLRMTGGVTGSPQLRGYSEGNFNGAPYVIQAIRGGLGNDGKLSLNPLGGNVGIGTTSPSEKLEVDGNVQTFKIIASTGTFSENVGIGTTNPVFNCDIDGSFATSNYIIVDSEADLDRYIENDVYNLPARTTFNMQKKEMTFDKSWVFNFETKVIDAFPTFVHSDTPIIISTGTGGATNFDFWDSSVVTLSTNSVVYAEDMGAGFGRFRGMVFQAPNCEKHYDINSTDPAGVLFLTEVANVLGGDYGNIDTVAFLVRDARGYFLDNGPVLNNNFASIDVDTFEWNFSSNISSGVVITMTGINSGATFSGLAGAVASNEYLFNISSTIVTGGIVVNNSPIAISSETQAYHHDGLDQTAIVMSVNNNSNLSDSSISGEGFYDLGVATRTLIPAQNAKVWLNGANAWEWDEEERLVGYSSGTVKYIGLETSAIVADSNVVLAPNGTNKNIRLQFCKIFACTPLGVTFGNATNVIYDTGTARLSGDSISFKNSTGTLPSELRKDIIYYVVNPTVDTFQVSYTSGGAVVTFTDDGIPGNAYDVASLIGSISQKTATAESEFVPRALVEMSTNQEIILVTWMDSAVTVDIDSRYGYARIHP